MCICVCACVGVWVCVAEKEKRRKSKMICCDDFTGREQNCLACCWCSCGLCVTGGEEEGKEEWTRIRMG